MEAIRFKNPFSCLNNWALIDGERNLKVVEKGKKGENNIFPKMFSTAEGALSSLAAADSEVGVTFQWPAALSDAISPSSPRRRTWTWTWRRRGSGDVTPHLRVSAGTKESSFHGWSDVRGIIRACREG